MAEDSIENENEDENEEKGGSGLKNIIIFAGVGILMLGLGVGGTFFFMGSKSDPDAEMAEEMAGESMQAEPEMTAEIYHNLHPAFVANFSGNSKKKYMQVYVVALAKEQSSIDDLVLHMPAVRNNVLMTLSTKTSDEVATLEGKEELRKEVLETVRKTMEEKTGKEGIEDLYFTKFVAQ